MAETGRIPLTVALPTLPRKPEECPAWAARLTAALSAHFRRLGQATSTGIAGAGGVSLPVSIANGGTGQTTAIAAFDGLDPLTAKGDLIVHDGTHSVRHAVGTDTFVLTADAAQTDGVKWAAAPGASSLTLTEVEKDLGVAAYSGTFDITGLAGLTASKQVLIVQKAGPYTGKGDRQDEAEMDQVAATGYVVDANTIRAYWVCQPYSGPVAGNVKFGWAVSA